MPLSSKTGKVYLVGAGPGDRDLITVRGLRLLQQAEVVVYDRLIDPGLVEDVHPAAERVYVGKSAGHHFRRQEEINAILIARAKEGHTVVRLKGGDPFVFGRGGEEALALAEEGIPFEIVPGISSSVAVPAYAGIPVTHRGVASSFTVITGHACEASREGHDWAALARIDTLVILMGVGRLAQIADVLLEHGRDPDTPVAVVSSGTTPEQEVVVGTLATIGTLVETVEPPATIIFGEVVRLRESLAWFVPPHTGSVYEGNASSAPTPFARRFHSTVA
jgi:uroporphyrin-III C-methyltransferase